MKTVGLVPSYRPKPERVGVVCNELRKFCERVVVFTTEPMDLPGCEIIIHNKSIVDNLVFEPRKWIVSHLEDDWDYVLYDEDDILITDKSFQAALYVQSLLKYPEVAGFLRFERNNGKKWWIDQHPAHGVHTGCAGRLVLNKDDRFWIPANFHSGNFLLSKEYVRRAIADGWFETSFDEKGMKYCGKAETGATGHYRKMPKHIPLDFELVECEHLDNKYYNQSGIPNTETLKKILHG